METSHAKETHAFAVVVNDDVTQLNVLTGLLRKEGIDVQAFENAEDALLAMGRKPSPDLIVTDLYMPDIDGWRFCRLLRSSEYDAFNQVPILVVSCTFAGDEASRITADLGANAFLPLPVDGRRFIAAVKSLLEGKAARDRLRILIVEDSQTVARLLKKSFREQGYQADVALNAQAAIDAFAKMPYDVAVIDYHLPDGKGDRLLAGFQQRCPDCVCIMMTTDPRPELALDWMRQGAAAYLRKPFEAEYLIELCARARRERALLRVEDLLEERTRKLRLTEAQYRGVFENSPDGMLVHAADETILDANETIARRLGIERQRLLGRKLGEFVASNNSTASHAHADALKGSPQVFETCYRSLSGATLIVEVHEQSIPWQDSDAILSISRDIADRKRAEEKLRELATVTEQAIEGIVLADLKGSILYVNDAWASMHGYDSTDELKGQPLSIFHTEEQFKTKVIPFNEAVKHYESNKGELDHMRKDGTTFPTMMTVTVLKDGQGKPYAIAGLAQNITERKHAEKQLLKTNRELEKATARANEMVVQAEQANAAKSEFLANMSHEIRTPMNGVIGMAGLLLDTELTDEQRRYAEIVRASGEALLNLINDILDFSKIEAKKLDLEVLDFDLESLLEDFAATLALRAHEKGLELLCGMAPEVPSLLRGDPGRLRQILTNLAGNAIKFTQEGEVSIRVFLESEEENHVLLRFLVRDTGIGIPSDKQDALFEQFTQVDASTTRHFGGTGLGLAISKQLVEMMGGEIAVQSEKGKGSEFWFTVRQEKQAQGMRAKTLPLTDLHGVRVLIVDDNATSREILDTRMTSWGMRVSEREDGPGALQALYKALQEEDPFRIAVIDMQIPNMDGETLGRAIKADTRLAELRMVILTSLGTRGDAKRFAKVGFDAYLTKPTKRLELKGVLSQVLTTSEGEMQGVDTIATRHSVRETRNLLLDREAEILLAEDNMINQQVALGMLRKLNLAADVVTNGAEALAALESLPYDLVLMDVQMPEMDGLEATRRIRNPRSAVLNHQVPIIAMTAEAMAGDSEKCLKAGMNDYISKPVALEALAEVLEKWLSSEEKLASTSSHTTSAESQETGNDTEPVTWDRAAMLRRLMGDTDLAGKIIEGFLGDIPRQIEMLGQLLETENAPAVQCQAHSIKGAAANVGGEALRQVAFEMEQAAKVGNLAVTKVNMQELLNRFDRLRKELNDCLENKSW